MASIEGECRFFTICLPGFVCVVLYYVKISGERLQDHWYSGFNYDPLFRQDSDDVLITS